MRIRRPGLRYVRAGGAAATAAVTAAASLLLLSGCQDHAAQATDSSSAKQARPAGSGSGAKDASSGVLFVDKASEAGLDFRSEIKSSRPMPILQAMSGGCAFLDFDNDGNLDILLMSRHVALYRGDGAGRFTNVTGAMGLSLPEGLWMGCAVGDYDNDGFDDMYLAAYRGGVLLRNRGGKAFQDVTKQAGITVQPWGSSCSFGDYDNDGRLDLFVGNYLKFGPDSVQLCTVGNVRTSCSPTVYEAEQGVLYHNEGNGRFKDVTKATGLNAATGKALGSLFFDADGTRRQSLYLANDEVPSDLMLNTGKGTFRNAGETSGLAYESTGAPYGGMGVDQGDINGDGLMDLVIATFFNEPKLVMINEGGGLFIDQGKEMGIRTPMLPFVPFGTRLFDLENDGDLDLIFANGYIADNIADYEPVRSYRQRSMLFRNENGKHFTDISQSAGPDLQRPIVGRGLAAGDYDNDGRIDILIVDAEGAPLLLHNETPNPGNYIALRLVGKKSNRNAYGAQVTVEAGGKKQIRACYTDGSYFAASDRRIHVGLGTAQSAAVTVRWPSGKTEKWTLSKVDETVTLREGDSGKSSGGG